eukprot:jgi/Bigna1/67758/fgenesh1_pg.4_\
MLVWKNKGAEGFLEKKGLVNWTKRRFIFQVDGENSFLRYFNQGGGTKGEIQASDILSVESYILSRKHRAFKIFSKSDVWLLRGDTEEDARRYQGSIGVNIVNHFIFFRVHYFIAKYSRQAVDGALVSILPKILQCGYRATLSKLMTRRTYKKGECIFKGGNIADCCLFLKRGHVGLYSNEDDGKGDGKKIGELVNVQRPYTMLGESVLMDKATAETLTTRAEVDVEALIVPKKKIEIFKDDHMEAVRLVSNLMGSKGVVKELKKIDFLSTMSDKQLSILMHGVQYKAVHKDEVVFYEGQVGDGFYIVYSGCVEVMKFSEEKNERFGAGDVVRLNRIRPGGWFGEIALCMDMDRTATVIAVESSLLMMISRDSFRAFLQAANMDVNEVMRKRIIQHLHAIFALVITFFLSSFATLPCLGVAFLHSPSISSAWTRTIVPAIKSPPSSAKNMAEPHLELQGVPHPFLRGDPRVQVIFAEGEPGDRFYIISRGQVSVRRDGKEIARLGTGRYFGEVSLVIEGCDRTATCIATKKSTLMSMDKENFRGFFENTPEALADVEIKIAGPKVQIRSIIYHPKALNLFTAYLQSQWASESIEFWIECRRFRKSSETQQLTGSQLQYLATKIIDKYIKSGSDKKINISANMQKLILERWEKKEIDETLFLQAETEVVILLDRDKFTAFKQTDAFKKFLSEQEGYGETPITPRIGETQSAKNKRLIRRGGSMLGSIRRGIHSIKDGPTPRSPPSRVTSAMSVHSDLGTECSSLRDLPQLE